MTAAVAGTKVEAKWDTQKRQQVTARVVAGQCLAAMNVLNKVSPEIKEEYENQTRQYKVEAFKRMGVKTPLDLANAMAEVDANLYGSKVAVSGDENKAQISYDECAVSKSIEEVGKFTPEQKEKMFQGMEACGQKMTKEFGFTSQTKLEGQTIVMTISK